VPFDDNPQDSNVSMLKWMKVVRSRSSGTANSRQSFGTSGWNMSRNKDETVATVDGDAKSMEEKGIATTFEIELVVVESNDETVATVDSGSIDENVIATTSETESAVVESDNETVATVDAGSIDENVINKTRQSILFQN